MQKSDGMNYAPVGKPRPVVEPGEFIFAAAHLDHGHIYGQCNGLLEAGGELRWVYDPDAKKVEQFQKRFPHVKVARSDAEILDDPEVKLVTDGVYTIVSAGLTLIGTALVMLALDWRLALVTFAGTFAQAPLGALTVHFHLNPWLVLSHFLLSMVILALGVVVLLEAWDVRGERVPGSLRRLALVVAGAAALMIVAGTLATAGGPHPGSSADVRRQVLRAAGVGTCRCR